MPQSLRTLIVEDRPLDAELVVRQLRRSGFDPEWRRVETEEDFIANLNPNLDIILCDYAMPGFSALRALEVLHEQDLNIPLIIVSGTIGEETAVAAMKHGAADYLLKDRPARLGAAVTLAMDQCRLRREREQAQQSMQQSEHKYRHLFESLSEAAFLIECSSHKIVDVNRCAEQLLGRTRTEILGMEVSSLFPADKGEEYVHYLLSPTATAAPQNQWAEGALVAMGGRQIPVQISIAPVGLYGRNLVLALMSDITLRKQEEAALLKAITEAEAANKAKDQFIARLSHELRTPLTPILLATTEMKSDEAVPAEIREKLEVIHRNVELEIKLIDDLLDVTRIVRGKIQLHQEVVDAYVCVRNALEICQSGISEKQLNVSMRLDADQHYVWADPTRLQQVFWNLLKNAVTFTPEHGEITIKSTNIGDLLRMEVSDTGIGIEPALLPRIFNTFEQGDQSKAHRDGGLGLGLSIAKSVIELHHGTLAAYSEGTDKGATFTLEIASLPDPKKSPVSAQATPFQRGGSQKILLVEDHLDTLRMLSQMLRKRGYNVRTADSVLGALEEAAKDRFDLLVSDLGLPDGSGFEIMQKLKQLYGMHGVAVSGFGTDDDIRRSRAAGFDEHLVKPISIQALDATVQRIATKAA